MAVCETGFLWGTRMSYFRGRGRLVGESGTLGFAYARLVNPPTRLTSNLKEPPLVEVKN